MKQYNLGNNKLTDRDYRGKMMPIHCWGLFLYHIIKYPKRSNKE